MAENTKACSLTESEIVALIEHHSRLINEFTIEEKLERMNYLNRRLKTFGEVEIVKEPQNGGDTNIPATATEKKDGW